MSSSDISLTTNETRTSQQSSLVESSEVHSFFFWFEDRVTLYELQNWCVERRSWPLVAVTVYMMAIVWGQSWMRNRKTVHMKNVLFAWNSGLALFSMLGVLRVLPAVLHQLNNWSFEDSMCTNRPDNVVSLWIYMFLMSKFVELGDTVFLVLRKRTVLFLHWYHHVTVLLYTWFAFTHNAPTGKYFILINFFVHSLMYTYFACQTIGLRAPKLVSMTITSLQILQMMAGIVLLVYSIVQYLRNTGCDVHPNIIASGIGIYGSYFALFVQFFVNSYFGGKKNKLQMPHDLNNNHIKIN